MANPIDETVKYPFTAFNFAVEIVLKDRGAAPLCSAAFSDCDGLDMSMEVKTIRQGGDNGRQIRFAGPVSYGTVTLKRGMTASFDLWDWFAAVRTDARLRADASVVVFAADGQTERVRFQLTRCLPVKLKAPTLSGKDGMVAIEEFQMVYETMEIKRPEGGAAVGVSLGFGAAVGVQAGLSVSAGGGIGGLAEITLG